MLGLHLGCEGQVLFLSLFSLYKTLRYVYYIVCLTCSFHTLVPLFSWEALLITLKVIKSTNNCEDLGLFEFGFAIFAPLSLSLSSVPSTHTCSQWSHQPRTFVHHSTSPVLKHLVLSLSSPVRSVLFCPVFSSCSPAGFLPVDIFGFVFVPQLTLIIVICFSLFLIKSPTSFAASMSPFRSDITTWQHV